MADNLRVAAIQVTGDRGLAGNLQVAGEWIDKAAGDGAKLIVLPENFAYYGQRDLAVQAAPESTPAGPARQLLRDKALEFGVWILGGTIPITENSSPIAENAAPGADSAGDKPYAASLLVSPDGKEITRYNKIHLFDVDVEESKATVVLLECRDVLLHRGGFVQTAEKAKQRFLGLQLGLQSRGRRRQSVAAVVRLRLEERRQLRLSDLA